MQLDRLVPFAIGGLALVMVGLGLISVGGPESARQQKRDQQRLLAIERLAFNCFTSLPAGSTDTSTCDNELFQDPLTDEPYPWKWLSPTEIEICAKFEVPGSLGPLNRYGDQFDRDTGCIRFDVSR